MKGCMHLPFGVGVDHTLGKKERSSPYNSIHSQGSKYKQTIQDTPSITSNNTIILCRVNILVIIVQLMIQFVRCALHLNFIVDQLCSWNDLDSNL